MVNVLWQKNKQTYLLIQLNSADLRRHFEGRSLGMGQLFHKTLVSFCPLPAATTKSKQVILTKDERKCKLLLLFCNFDQIWYSLWRCHLGLCHGWHFWRTSLRRTSLLDSCSYKIAVWTETQKKILTTSSQQRHRKSGWCFVFKSPSSVSTRLCTDDFFFFFFCRASTYHTLPQRQHSCWGTVRGLAVRDWLGDYDAQTCTVNSQEFHPNHTTSNLVTQTEKETKFPFKPISFYTAKWKWMLLIFVAHICIFPYICVSYPFNRNPAVLFTSTYF